MSREHHINEWVTDIFILEILRRLGVPVLAVGATGNAPWPPNPGVLLGVGVGPACPPVC